MKSKSFIFSASILSVHSSSSGTTARSVKFEDVDLDGIAAEDLAKGIGDILEGARDISRGRLREGLDDIFEGVRDIASSARRR